MSNTIALRQPFSLRLATILFVTFWALLAVFPLFWITVMSFKLPVDALASNPLQVIFGTVTRQDIGGLSLIHMALIITALVLLYKIPGLYGERVATMIFPARYRWLGWVVATALYALVAITALWWILPIASASVSWLISPIPFVDHLAKPMIGFTTQHYEAVWIDNGFYKNFINSLIVTAGVVAISLTVGTLAGYGLARSGSNLAFWLLIAALIFRALPHSVLVTGYLPPFINSAEILRPLLGDAAPTLYGQPWAVIIVLVSINQPFTIWMLRSFFQNIPAELDEAARVDGCSHFEAFRRVIMPVMWPGVITTGLFSFLLAYNDYLVTALLLDAQNQTMVPAITQYFNRETTTTDQIEAVAAAVSITAPLFLLVMVFQKQIVSGLTAGAVKG